MNSVQENRFLEAKILIVDDSEFSRCLISEVFKGQGFRNIEVAQDGRLGLEKTKQIKPDLVILDLMMPEMDGFEYCEAIRKDPEFANMPILIQSAVTVSQDVSKAFKAGATDFVNKPIKADEVISRAKVHIENKFMMQDLNMYRSRVESELKLARAMQDSLMPKERELSDLSKTYHLDIAAYFEPSFEIGGDFWGTKAISPNQLAIYNVDLSGHGIAAAINTFRFHTVLHEHGVDRSDPSEYLSSLNKRMKELLPIGHFATMFYGIINTEENKLYYSSAAAPTPFLINQGGKNIVNLESAGLPIGATGEASYEIHTVEFNKGDILFLYSDALIETENDCGEFLSETSIVEIIKKSSDKKSQEILNDMLGVFKNHANGAPDDDLTICVCRRM